MGLYGQNIEALYENNLLISMESLSNEIENELFPSYVSEAVGEKLKKAGHTIIEKLKEFCRKIKEFIKRIFNKIKQVARTIKIGAKLLKTAIMAKGDNVYYMSVTVKNPDMLDFNKIIPDLNQFTPKDFKFKNYNTEDGGEISGSELEKYKKKMEDKLEDQLKKYANYSTKQEQPHGISSLVYLANLFNVKFIKISSKKENTKVEEYAKKATELLNKDLKYNQSFNLLDKNIDFIKKLDKKIDDVESSIKLLETMTDTKDKINNMFKKDPSGKEADIKDVQKRSRLYANAGFYLFELQCLKKILVAAYSAVDMSINIEKGYIFEIGGKKARDDGYSIYGTYKNDESRPTELSYEKDEEK